MTCLKCGLDKKIFNIKNSWCRPCYNKNIKLGIYNVRKIKKIPEKFTQKQNDILIGSMLGDGWLSPKKNNSYLRINRSIKDLEYLEYEYLIFNEFINQPIKHYKSKNKYNLVSFATLSSNLFSEYRDIWYPNNTKIIPNNLTLNNDIIGIWFCDDGCFVKRSKKFYLDIATNGFSKNDTEMLADKLNNFYSCSYFTIKKHDLKSNNDYGYKISANAEGSLFFYEQIKKYIPKEMSRKLLGFTTTSKTN